MLNYPLQSFDNRLGTLDTTAPWEVTMENRFLHQMGFFATGEG